MVKQIRKFIKPPFSKKKREILLLLKEARGYFPDDLTKNCSNEDFIIAMLQGIIEKGKQEKE